MYDYNLVVVQKVKNINIISHLNIKKNTKKNREKGNIFKKKFINFV